VATLDLMDGVPLTPRLPSEPQQRLLSTPAAGHRAARWTPMVSIGRFWDRTPPGAGCAEDTVINVLTEGGYALEHDGGWAPADPARLFFMRRGVPFATRHGRKPRSGLYLRLHTPLWEELHQAIGGPPDVRSVPLRPGFAVALHELVADAPDMDVDAFEEQAFALAEQGLRDRPVARWAGHAAAVRAVRRRLVDEPGMALGLDELARGVGLTRFQLARAFQAHAGTSVSATREAVRMGIALDRVRRGQDLSELALELGYTSHAHFTQRFGSTFGRPPSALRRARI
jgi:AraC-like DNA-binding protein